MFSNLQYAGKAKHMSEDEDNLLLSQPLEGVTAALPTFLLLAQCIHIHTPFLSCR